MASADEALFITADTRCWRSGADALVLTLVRDRPTITRDVLDALVRSLALAESGFATLVVASAARHFGFGADLDAEFAAAAAGDVSPLDAALANYQQVMLALRHAAIPTVAAVRGVAVSGTCELLMHTTRVVAHPASHIGLGEAMMGVVPGGGGLKEFALRAGRTADPVAAIKRHFATVSAAMLSHDAAHAQALGFLTAEDRVDAQAPLDAALELGRAIHAAGHAPPPRDPVFAGAGVEVRGRLSEGQAARLANGTLTPHQFDVDVRIAEVLCGSAPAGALRTESDLLAAERAHFLVLAQTAQTAARLAHYRSTGAMLRN